MFIPVICLFKKKSQLPCDTDKDKSGEGDEGKDNDKNNDDKAQPDLFRCGKTGHITNDYRSVMQQDGHYVASVS